MHSTFAEIPAAVQIRSYLLRLGSHHCPLRSPFLCLDPPSLLHDARLQPFLDQADDSPIPDSVLHELAHPRVIDLVEKRPDVKVEHPVHLLSGNPDVERVPRLVRASPWPVPIRKAQEILSPIWLRTVPTACWTTLSSSAVIPHGRCLPSLFGIQTLRAGLAP